MPNATLRQRANALARRLFGYAEPCPKCGAETRYELQERVTGRLDYRTEGQVWKVCTKCDWGQRRV